MVVFQKSMQTSGDWMAWLAIRGQLILQILHPAYWVTSSYFKTTVVNLMHNNENFVMA
jgi:hypothetical protein